MLIDKPRRLRVAVWLTHAGLLAERLSRAFWPLVTMLLLAMAFFSFGLHSLVGETILLALTGVAALIAVAALVMGARTLRWPTATDALLRVDKTLVGRPIAALADDQAVGAEDVGSSLVWQEHRRRMAARVAQARYVSPDFRLARQDRWALRYVAATAFAAAMIFGVSASDIANSDRLTAAGSTIAQGPVFEGWIEPPTYTGVPSIYLNDVLDRDELVVPQGSRVTLRFYGDTDPRVSETVSSDAEQAVRDGTSDATFFVEQSGRIAISSSGAEWVVTVIPDTPPTIAAIDAPSRTPSGQMTVPFEAADDYGVIAGTLTIKLDLARVDRRHGLAPEPEPQKDIVLDIPLPYTGGTEQFEDVILEDLARHPWAGLPVKMQFAAEDAAGQVSNTAPDAVILPGRRFFDPLAASIAEQRRDLLWSRSNAIRVAQVVRAVTHMPDELFDNEKAYLILRTALRRLEFNSSPKLSDEVRADVADMFWRVALLIEDGDIADAAERLRRAQERLAEALRNGASEEELAELMEELRQAMQDYMQQLARDSEQDPNAQQRDTSEAMEITPDQLQEMMDRIEELAREGRTEEAQALLDQLRQMMENLEVARRQQNSTGEQSMEDLQNTLRQQQGLSDEAFRELQEQFNQSRSGQSNENVGRNGQIGSGQTHEGQGEGSENGSVTSGQQLAERQEALRQLLEQQRNGLPQGDTTESRAARDALSRADREMEAARQALEDGALREALDRQADAMSALREGIDNLGDALAANQDRNVGQQGDQGGAPRQDASRDPLGRQSGANGRIGSDERLVPGDALGRSREIREEIRRRSGDRSRPQLELDYLERLLDRF